MENEISAHAKKALHAMEKPDFNIWEKIKKIALEVTIIVFAVMVSIWFHDQSEHKHQQAEVKEFLEGLREDLKADVSSMKNEIVTQERAIKASKIVTAIKTEKDLKVVKKGTEISLTSDYSFRVQNTGNYDSFESSGKLGYLENKELKKRILGYYHQMPLLIRIENMYNKNIDQIREISPKYKGEKGLFFDPFFQQAIQLQKVYSENLVKAYKELIEESEKTFKLIDEELKK